MAYEVVARRWRPLTFDSVVGQRHVTATLARAIELDRVAHAFLFTGIRGVGKTTVARLLARALNCTDRQGSEPCNQCSSCTQILAGASVDVLEIDGASNRGIDEVRALIEAAAYRPAGGRFRIYIIDEVHQLTREAFNALLKLLEEPPAHVKFIMATTEPHKVPQTVLSRCQRYDFRRLSTDEIATQLGAIAAKDGMDLGEDVLALLAREADGSMRDAQSLLEQVAAAVGSNPDLAAVTEVLGVASTELVVSCVEAIIESDPKAVVAVIHELKSVGYDPERFLSEILDAIHAVAMAAAAGTEALGPSTGEATRKAAERLATKRDPLDLQRIFSSLLRTAEDLRRAGMPELVLEMGLLKASLLESVTSVSEVLDRIDRLTGGSDSGTPQGGRPQSATPVTRGRRTPSVSKRSAPAALSSVEDTPAPSAPPREPTAVDPPSPTPEDQTAQQWDEFLRFVREHAGIDLFVTLSNCEVCVLTEGMIEVRTLVNGFRRKLEEGKALQKLSELASSYFERDTKFRLAGAGGSSGGMSAHSIDAERTAKLEERALADPLVKAAVATFGGRVGKISRVDE